MIREKATLQQLADRFQGYVTADGDGAAYIYNERPEPTGSDWWCGGGYYRLDYLFGIDYTGDWKDSLHSPQHVYKEGELVFVWVSTSSTFAHVRKVHHVEDGRMYTLYPRHSVWNYYRRFDKSLLGDPIAEWPEE